MEVFMDTYRVLSRMSTLLRSVGRKEGFDGWTTRQWLRSTCHPLPDHDEESGGYLLEVDIEYPKEIDEAHVDLPFCPVREHAPEGKQTKLLATVDDKERYVIHYRYLYCIPH